MKNISDIIISNDTEERKKAQLVWDAMYAINRERPEIDKEVRIMGELKELFREQLYKEFREEQAAENKKIEDEIEFLKQQNAQMQQQIVQLTDMLKMQKVNA